MLAGHIAVDTAHGYFSWGLFWKENCLFSVCVCERGHGEFVRKKLHIVPQILLGPI